MAYKLCDTDTAAAWWTCHDCEFDRMASYAELAHNGNPICPLCDCDMVLADPETVEKRHKVVISVRGGVAEIQTCPEGIEVEIVDHDDQLAEQEAGCDHRAA